MPDLSPSPQRETEGTSPWMWGVLILVALLVGVRLGDYAGIDSTIVIACLGDIIVTDHVRSLLMMLLFFCCSLYRVTQVSGPPLSPWVRTQNIVPSVFPNWERTRHRLRYSRRRRYCYPQHYHLRRKILQRNPLLVGVCTDHLPWDPHEQIRLTWISELRMKYGPYFDDFCLSIGPRTQLFRSSTRSLGDWNKKKTSYSAQGEQTGCKSDEEKGCERTTQYWVLKEFCNSFDPRLPLRLLTESPGIPRVVGHDLRMINFVPNVTRTRQDHLILVNAARLEGKYYDTNIKCEVYWGTQSAGD
jgi:hypothetical protein